MPYVLTILFSIALHQYLWAQQLYFIAGYGSSDFQYSTSEGASDLEFYSEPHFNFEMGFRVPILRFLYGSGSVVYNRYHVYSNDAQYEAYYEWDTHWVGLAAALEAEVYRHKSFSFLLRAAAEPQLLVAGSQRENTNIYSLKGVEQFDAPFLFVRGGPGINFCADERMVITARYYYGYGFPLGSDEGEQLRITSQTVAVGLLIGIGQCRYCHHRRFE